MPNFNDIARRLNRKPVWIAGAAVILALAFLFVWRAQPKPEAAALIFHARRGPLDISVAEGGSVQALESQESRSEVKGYQGTKILKIVEEGYAVTEEDVKNGKVLVELDSSEIRNKITQQDIQFESTAASLIDAQQAYEIQVNQNTSDVMAAEQKAKFARMDFEKFMGNKAAAEIISKLGLDIESEPLETNALPALAKATTKQAPLAGGGLVASAQPQLLAMAKAPAAVQDAPVAIVSDSGGIPGPQIPAASTNTEAILGTEAGSSSAPPPPAPPRSIDFNFKHYANSELLGDGEARQKIRKLDDDLQVAEKERLLAQSTYEGTKRLFDKEFATRTELDNDELKLQNSKLKVQTAETARALFMNYEFPKTAEETLSKYAEAVRELDRARKGAISKLAQAEAKLKSAQGRYNLEARQREELQEQLEKCLIKAKRQGLVVYGGGNEEGFYYGGEERIREGATVRERQAIITIPDTTKMCVKVKIHETYIKKVKKGQTAKITVDAYPETILQGEVMQVGVLPDSQNRWMNPDLKVYLTTIRVEGTHEWLKPGMTAKVEIMVKRLPDVVYVPIQAVSTESGKQFCYVMNGSKQQRRQVEVGDFGDEFIEVKAGLKEGDRVCLRAPELPGIKEEQPGQPAPDKTEPAAAPVAQAASAG